MPDNQNSVDDLKQQVASLQSEIATLKNKDTEVAIANLRKEVADRDTLIVEKDKSIAGLQTQITTITDSSKSLEQRVQVAETALAEANDTIKTLKAVEAKRTREALLRDKNAPEDVISSLVDKLSILDDTAFAATVDTISGSWRKPAKGDDPIVEAVKKAKAEEEPSLTVSDEDGRENTFASLVDFMGKSMKSARVGRPSIYANINGDA